MKRKVLSSSLAILTEATPKDIEIMRQAARTLFMESLNRDSFDPDQFAASADKWWPGTV